MKSTLHSLQQILVIAHHKKRFTLMEYSIFSEIKYAFDNVNFITWSIIIKVGLKNHN